MKKRAVITTPYPTLEQIAEVYGMPLAKAREFGNLPFENQERKRKTHSNGRASTRGGSRKASARRKATR